MNGEMHWQIATVALTHEADVVVVRQRARRASQLLGFETQDQTRIATAVSEIARNAIGYAGGGRAELCLESGQPQVFTIAVSDHGPGIARLDDILEGRYRSRTGMGLGIAGARRLMDRFAISSSPDGGTRVVLSKTLPRRSEPVAPAKLAEIIQQLARDLPCDAICEVREQNRELLQSLDEVRIKQDELGRLNAELQDTNRGVVALYAELDETAAELRRASDLKSSFLSEMSHEFRTPLNSILALSRLLQDEADGPLTPEQVRQVGYIRTAATGLTELVNDLLDIAKVESGKIELRPGRFSIGDLFAGLRGALKPLRTSPSVEVVFDATVDGTVLHTDEVRLAQVLRNFISNALKFTEQGEVRIAATLDPAGERVTFSVRDTGIGIPGEHLQAIFEEFAQIENPLQHRVKGTGLGLSLARRLAGLLGGDVRVESELGVGSTFFLSVPRDIVGDAAPLAVVAGGGRTKVLVIDDDEAFRYLLRQMIGETRYEVVEAVDGIEGLRRALADQPAVIFLDLQMPRLDGYAVLSELAAAPATSGIAVIVSTAGLIDPAQRSRLSHASAVLSKQVLSGEVVSVLLREMLERRT